MTVHHRAPGPSHPTAACTSGAWVCSVPSQVPGHTHEQGRRKRSDAMPENTGTPQPSSPAAARSERSERAEPQAMGERCPGEPSAEKATPGNTLDLHGEHRRSPEGEIGKRSTFTQR